MRAFLLVWTGQIVSLVGSGLTAFALGVTIFQRSGSTTAYALVTFAAAVPPLVVLPLAGPLIDRFRRKSVLVLCDLAGLAATAALGLLASRGALTLPAACAIVAAMATATAIQAPAWSAAVTLMVPREQLGRASGMTQVAMATSQIAAPVLAGAVIVSIGLAGITAIDAATFLFSMATLLAAAIPEVTGASDGTRGYRRDLPLGWRYIFARRGLLALLATIAAVNFASELASVLFTPWVLTMATPAVLGSILAVGGVGMIAGGGLMAAWGGPRRPALGAVLLAGASCVAVALAGLTSAIPVLGALVFVFFFCQPLFAGSSQVIWQRTVPAEMQGRVFAARYTIALSTVPLASLAAGPLGDAFARPGAGAARGFATIIFWAGITGTLAAVAGGLSAPLRRLDDETGPGAMAPATAEG